MAIIDQTVLSNVSGTQVEVGGGVEASALRVTLANDSTGLLSVDDNGASLTVDGPLTDAELRATPVDVNITGGTVTIGAEVEISNDVGNPVPVNDAGGSLTIDNINLDTPLSTLSTILSSLLKPADTLTKVTTVDTITNVVHVDDNAGSLTVDANNLDIRDLVFSTDKVDVSGSVLGTGSNIIGFVKLTDGVDTALVSGSGELNVIATAQPGVDIGDVTVNNAAGASAVNIQDGGNSITVDNTNLDTPLSTLNTTLNSLLKPANTLAAITTVGTITNVVHVDDNGSTLSIDDGGGSITVDGTITATLAATVTEDAASAGGESSILVAGVRNDTGATKTTTDGDFGNISLDSAGRVGISDLGGSISIDDNSGSITIDNANLDTALSTLNTSINTLLKPANTLTAVTTVGTITNVVHVDDNGSTLSIDDGGGSITVDGSVTVSGSLTADTELTLKDYDIGAGTDNVAVVGILLPKSGGAVAGGTSTDPIRVDPTGTTAQPITDNGGSLTVDGSVTVTQTTGTNLHTVLDSGTLTSITNVVHVDDNSGSLTVDNGGTFAVQDSQVIADNAGFTDGTSKVFLSGYVFDDVAGTALTENDAAAARIDSKRAQVFTLEDATTRGQKATVSAAGALKVDGSAVTQPVSGTVTVTQGTGTNLHTVIDSGTITTITNVVHVDDNSGSLTVDGTVTANAGTGFPSVQTEDAASAGGETGTMILGVRNDSAVSKTSTDGDFSALAVDAAGRLGITDLGGAISVDDNGGSLTIDNANLDAPLSTLDTSINTLLKPASTLSAVTTLGTITNVVHVDDNGSTLSIDDGGGSITIDGSVSVSGAVDTELPAAAALADNTANPTVPAVGAFGMVWDGANWDRTPGNQTDGILVNLGANNDVTVTGSITANAGTNLNTSALALEATLQSVKTAVETIDNAIAGSEMQVDVVGSLPSGSNTIGNVKLTDGTDVADILDLANSNPLTVAIVDASGDQITSFGSGTQYTEDVAAAADPVGTMSMAVRADSLAAVTSTDGDNIALRATNKGEIYVKHVDSIPITDNGGSLTVDGTVTITPSGTQDINLSQVNGNAVNVGTGAAGTGTQRVTTSTDSTIGTVTSITNVVHVDDNSSSLTVDNGGTFVVQENGAALTSLQLIDDVVYTDDTSTHSTGSSKGLAMMGVATPTDTAVNANDFGVIGMTNNREQYTVIRDSAGNLRGANVNASNQLEVSVGTGANGPFQSEDSASNNFDGGVGCLAVRKATPANTSGTDGDYEFLQMSAGRLWASATIDSALPAGTNAIGKLAANSGVTIGAVEIAASQTIATTNAGTFAVQDSQVIADNAGFTDGTSKVFMSGFIYDEVAGTALTENDAAAGRINVNRAIVHTIEDGVTRGRYATVTASNALKVDGSAVTQPVSISGNQAINLVQANGTTIDTNSGNKSAGTIRTVIATDQPQLTTPLNVTSQAGTTGGYTTYHLVSAATTNATNIKASAGKVAGWYIYNSNASARKVAFHNTAGTPTAGAPVFFSIVIPGSAGANLLSDVGIDFSTGIAITTTTGLADTDSAAVALNDLVINIFYK